MIYVFVFGFVALGIYCIVKGLLMRKHLDPEREDYQEMRKKSNRCIRGGILLILLGIWRYYTRVVLWGWG